jgi:transcriptional regulator with XRE-family HTH domain
MKARIQEFLKAENKTSAQFAEEIGVQPSGISHILSGRNKPSLDFVLKMLERYPFLSTEWLLFGNGNMYKEPQMQELFDKSLENITQKEAIEQDVDKFAHKEPNKTDYQENKPERGQYKTDIEKIIWFYPDNSFREFMPGED